MLAMGLMATSVLANQVSIDWFPGGNASVATIYNNQGGAVRSFTTFCLEDREYFYPGWHYNYTIDDVVYQGYGSSLPHTGTPPSVVLTKGAVDLYLAYVGGTLTDVSASAVQNAIWACQGYGVSYDSRLASYIDRTDYRLGNYPGIHVINLYDAKNNDGLNGYDGQPNGVRQSYIYVPDGGLTVMLLGMGMVAVGWVRRFVK